MAPLTLTCGNLDDHSSVQRRNKLPYGYPNILPSWKEFKITSSFYGTMRRLQKKNKDPKQPGFLYLQEYHPECSFFCFRQY